MNMQKIWKHCARKYISGILFQTTHLYSNLIHFFFGLTHIPHSLFPMPTQVIQFNRLKWLEFIFKPLKSILSANYFAPFKILLFQKKKKALNNSMFCFHSYFPHWQSRTQTPPNFLLQCAKIEMTNQSRYG